MIVSLSSLGKILIVFFWGICVTIGIVKMAGVHFMQEQMRITRPTMTRFDRQRAQAFNHQILYLHQKLQI